MFGEITDRICAAVACARPCLWLTGVFATMLLALSMTGGHDTIALFLAILVVTIVATTPRLLPAPVAPPPGSTRIPPASRGVWQQTDAPHTPRRPRAPGLR